MKHWTSIAVLNHINENRSSTSVCGHTLSLNTPCVPLGDGMSWTSIGRTATVEPCFKTLMPAHGQTSTASQLQARRIMEHLVTAPLSRSWNKPIVDCLSWFLCQVNCCNELALFETDRLTPTTVRTMLERNVQAAPPLAAVRDCELFEIAR